MDIYGKIREKQGTYCRKEWHTMAIYRHMMEYHIPPRLSLNIPRLQGHQGLLGCCRESGAHPREASEEAPEGANTARCQIGSRRRRRARLEAALNQHLLGILKGQHVFFQKWLKTSLIFPDWFYSCGWKFEAESSQNRGRHILCYYMYLYVVVYTSICMYAPKPLFSGPDQQVVWINIFDHIPKFSWLKNGGGAEKTGFHGIPHKVRWFFTAIVSIVSNIPSFFGS